MNYRTIIMCALIGASIQNAWAMDAADKNNRAQLAFQRDELLERGKFWRLSGQELEGSNEEIANRIKSKEAERSPDECRALKARERVYLATQGFCGLASKGD